MIAKKSRKLSFHLEFLHMGCLILVHKFLINLRHKARLDCESDCVIGIALFAFQSRISTCLGSQSEKHTDRIFSNFAFHAHEVLSLVRNA